MRVTCKLNPRCGILLVASAAALVLNLQASAAWAETASGPGAVGAAQSSASQLEVGSYQVASTAPMTRRRSGRYFIEFRARSANSYGHMYVLYGRVNGRRQIVKSEIAGLHPAGDASDCLDCSRVPWTIGHLIFVPAETGPSDGDLEEKYVTARYRLWLSAAEYKNVSAYIAKLKANTKVWNALWANCVGFGRNVATHMGLSVPGLIWMKPDFFVTSLRKLNGGPAKEQLPLKDAPNSLKSSAGFRTPLPKQVSLPPSRPTAALVAAVAPAAESAEAKRAVTPAATVEAAAKPSMEPKAEKAAEPKTAMKPKAEKAAEPKSAMKPAPEGLAVSSATF
jgi:hypothetical protein